MFKFTFLVSAGEVQAQRAAQVQNIHVHVADFLRPLRRPLVRTFQTGT